MQPHKIERIQQAKFLITFEGQDNVILDFMPIIEAHKLTGNYCLLHWRAKPRGLGDWGIYDSKTDSYLSFERSDMLPGLFNVKIVGIDEPKTLPSEVVHIKGYANKRNDNSIEVRLI